MERNEALPNDQGSVAQPLTTSLAVLAGLCRIVTFLIPYLSNFNLVGGLGIFGGARLKSWRAYVVPFAILLITNALLGWIKDPRYFFSGIVLFQYFAFFLYVFIGRYLKNTESPLRIGAGSVLGSILFFLITNFGTWLLWGYGPGYVGPVEPGQYPLTLSGLIVCYFEGLPFLPRTLLGDLVCTGTLFGLQAVLSRRLHTDGVKAQPASIA